MDIQLDLIDIIAEVAQNIGPQLILLFAIIFGALGNYFNHQLILKRLEDEQEFELEKNYVITKLSFLRYIVIMIATFASFYGSYFHLEQEINIELGLYLIIAINLILIALIDNHGYLTPNKLLYSLSSLVTILLLYQNNLNPNAVISNIGSAFLFMGFSFILFLAANFGDEAESFSINNVKLSFIIGLLLGFSGFIPFIILTGIAGVIYGNFWKKLFGSNSFPFTPTICISAFTCLLYAESLSVENFFEQLSYIGINL